MRCLNVLAFIVFFGFLNAGLKSQDTTKTLSPYKQNLPQESLKSKYRIQIMESGKDDIEAMRLEAKAFNIKFKRNVYILKNRGSLSLQAGDFTEKRYAKQSLTVLKKQYRKSKIVRSPNDSILEFTLVERRKPLKATSGQADTYHYYKKDSGKMSDWNDPKYQTVNFTKSIDYLSEQEKLVYYYLNLVRINPGLFADTYLAELKDSKDYYENSLMNELYRMQPIQVLKPCITQFESARCHAIESGTTGYVGHGRKNCNANFLGECCSYGFEDALKIVKQLLIDKGVESLGHRRICLSNKYTVLGVSIQPHNTYQFNAVLDFSVFGEEPTAQQITPLSVQAPVATIPPLSEQFQTFVKAYANKYNTGQVALPSKNTDSLIYSLHKKMINVLSTKFEFNGEQISSRSLIQRKCRIISFYNPVPYIWYEIGDVIDGKRVVTVVEGHKNW